MNISKKRFTLALLSAYFWGRADQAAFTRGIRVMRRKGR